MNQSKLEVTEYIRVRLYENKSSYKKNEINMKMCFAFRLIVTQTTIHFHMIERLLVLKQRHKVSRKWPVNLADAKRWKTRGSESRLVLVLLFLNPIVQRS